MCPLKAIKLEQDYKVLREVIRNTVYRTSRKAAALNFVLPDSNLQFSLVSCFSKERKYVEFIRESQE